MIACRLLCVDDFASLYECFLSAFSDYEVDMRMSREQFGQRIIRDGVRVEMSVAAFDADRMIGFCINGTGVWQGKPTAYDAGTGVVPGYRGRGIGKELFAFMVPRLKDAGISQYLLEVLTSNLPAVALYRKLGFEETRRLAVFRSDKPIHSGRDASIRPVERRNWDLYQSFWDRHPSWQNSIDAVERIARDTVTIGAFVDEECVGYAVAFRPAASLMQLAVASAHRRKGIGSAILSALQAEVSSTKSLKVNNIDEELKGTLAFYEANGFRQVLHQYEMIKSL
jgi:ribosomal protein S18 acetylase RimI-like enzyme